MSLLDTSNAVLFEAALRNPNHFWMLDNSRGALKDVVIGRRTSATHYFNQANIRMGHSMVLVGSYAVSGKLQTDFLAKDKLDAVLASDAKYCVIGGPVNDAGAAGFDPTYDQFLNIVKPACEYLIGGGVTPIIRTEPGQVSKSASSPFRLFYQAYNQKVKA